MIPRPVSVRVGPTRKSCRWGRGGESKAERGRAGRGRERNGEEGRVLGKGEERERERERERVKERERQRQREREIAVRREAVARLRVSGSSRAQDSE